MFDENRLEQYKLARVANVMASPMLTPEQFDLATGDADAIIFEVYATGTSPDRLNETIRKKTDSGTPVFLVSNNPGDSHGILKATYQTQVNSEAAGAFRIAKANVNQLAEINDVIQKEFNKGLRGNALGLAVTTHFSYKEGDSIPKPDWENPEAIAQQKELYKKTLIRTGASPEEIAKTLQEWEFGKSA